MEKQGKYLLDIIPHDPNIYRYDYDGKPIVEFPANSLVRSALRNFVEKLKL